jgi:hypothetical protein
MGFLELLQRPPKPIASSSASNYLYALKHHLVCHAGYVLSGIVYSPFLAEERAGQHVLGG